MFIALVLIIVGVVMLLKNLGVITAEAWDIVWPVALIALGLSMVWRRKTTCHMPWCKCNDCEAKSHQS